MNNEPTRALFDKKGYHIIRGLLSEDEAEFYRFAINGAFDLPRRALSNADIGSQTYTLPDGVTKTPEFWPLIFNQRLIASIRELLGNDIRYTQHSDLHINLGAGKFHRDSAYREFGVGPDWDEREAAYRVVRVAIYLSDYTDSGSSLIVLPGTHRRESRLNKLELRFWSEVRTRWRKRFDTNSMPQYALTMSRETIRHRAGDCIVFDQRLVHAGGIVRGKMPKYAIYLSYGADNLHSHNHHNYYLNRPTYLPKLPTDLSSQLDTAGLRLISRTSSS